MFNAYFFWLFVVSLITMAIGCAIGQGINMVFYHMKKGGKL